MWSAWESSRPPGRSKACRSASDSLPAVDQEVERHAQRQAEDPHHILDHVVGLGEFQTAGELKGLPIRGGQPGLLGQGLQPLLQRQVVEGRQSGGQSESVIG